MSKRRKRKRQPAARRSASAANGGPAPVGRIETIKYQDFLQQRKKHGAQESDTATMLEKAAVSFQISGDDVISEVCIECMEFLSKAAHNSKAAIDILDCHDADNAHLTTALKKYVEDTGEALRQIDNRLKACGSSLEDLFPDLPGDAEDAVTWRDLIARRAVIAHRILSIDSERVRAEADRDFRQLHALLRNINFVPTAIDHERGQIFNVGLRGAELLRLPMVSDGIEMTKIGSSLIFVCQDMHQGMLTFRIARKSDRELLIYSGYDGDINLSIHKLTEQHS